MRKDSRTTARGRSSRRSGWADVSSNGDRNRKVGPRLAQRMLLSRRSLLAAAAATAAVAPLTSVRAAASLMAGGSIKAADGRNVRVSHWASLGDRRGVILFSHGAL